LISKEETKEKDETLKCFSLLLTSVRAASCMLNDD